VPLCFLPPIAQLPLVHRSLSYDAVIIKLHFNTRERSAIQPLDDTCLLDAVAMSATKIVTELERRFGESQNQRDARVERLWSRLDPTGKGELDLNGLQKGFRRIDHRELAFKYLVPMAMDQSFVR
jgi:siroheme synthase